MVRCLSLLVLFAATATVNGMTVHGRQVSMDMHAFPPRKNCRRHGRRAAMVQKVNMTGANKLPGTGTNTSTSAGELAAGKLYMDGFSTIGCIKDYMFYHGDKHGDNKFSYEIGGTSRVSITIYSDMVPKEDMKPMTPDVCFDFCRVQKDMYFFGISNGISCYCAPYVEAMASDNSVCDTPCDGDAGVLCGSKSKSSVFEMHSCDDTGGMLAGELESFEEALGLVKTSATKLKACAAFMITESNTLQEKFGKNGDPVVGDLFQKAIVIAADAQDVATKALAFEAAQETLLSTAEALESKDMSLFTNANAADEAIASMAKGKATAMTQGTAVNKSASEFMPSSLGVPEDKGEAEQYYPIMYFIDKAYQNTTATCGGDLADVDMGLTKDACAAKCDKIDSAQKSPCVAFLYVPGKPTTEMSGLPDSYCFTFGKLTSVQYYTGCDSGFFLQAKRRSKDTACYGKLSKFTGGAPVLDKTRGQKASEASMRCVPEV